VSHEDYEKAAKIRDEISKDNFSIAFLIFFDRDLLKLRCSKNAVYLFFYICYKNYSMKTKILGVVASYSFQQLHFPRLLPSLWKILNTLTGKELSKL
jgi:hypothetical protein